VKRDDAIAGCGRHAARRTRLAPSGETLFRRFRDAVADALRARILDEGRRIEARGSFSRGLLCHRYRRRDTRITHTVRTADHIFPAMTMAASPRQIDRSRSRSGRPRQAARYSPKFALPFKLTGSTFSNGAILRLPADCRTIRNRRPRPLVRRSPTKRRGTSKTWRLQKGSLKRSGKLSVIEGEYAGGDAHVDTGECAAQTRPRLQSCSGFRRSAPI
jgi:hypothetical protein